MRALLVASCAVGLLMCVSAKPRTGRDWSKLTEKDWQRIEEEWETPEEKEEYEFKPPKQKGALGRPSRRAVVLEEALCLWPWITEACHLSSSLTYSPNSCPPFHPALLAAPRRLAPRRSSPRRSGRSRAQASTWRSCRRR